MTTTVKPKSNNRRWTHKSEGESINDRMAALTPNMRKIVRQHYRAMRCIRAERQPIDSDFFGVKEARRECAAIIFGAYMMKEYGNK